MIIYVKDKKTYQTKAVATALDWEIHQSIYDTVSTATIRSPKIAPEEGDLVIFDGTSFVGIITEVSVSGNETELSFKQGVTMFSRPMFYTASSYAYLEDNLEDLIGTNYANCTDAVYKISYLTATAQSHTAGSVKPDLDNNIYTVQSYISKLRRLKNIVCDWGFSNTALNLYIYRKDFPTYNIDLSNPKFRIKEQTMSSQTVGKLTVYCEDNGNYYTRYLKTDGTITATYSATDRVEGEWQTLIIKEYADLTESVQDEFATNYYSHKISFETERDFELYDRLTIRMDGRLFSSYVSGIITNKTNYRTVECGELQTQYPFLKRL